MRLCSSLCIERQRVGTRLTYGLTMKTPNGVNVELDYGQEKCLRLVLGGTGTSWQRTTKIPLDCAYEKKACVIDCQRNEPCHTEMPRVWQIQDHPLRRLESFYLHSPQCNSADYGERRSWRSCSSLDKWGRRENVVFVKVHSSLFVIFTSNCVPEKVDKHHRMQLRVQFPIVIWRFVIAIMSFCPVFKLTHIGTFCLGGCHGFVLRVVFAQNVHSGVGINVIIVQNLASVASSVAGVDGCLQEVKCSMKNEGSSTANPK